MRSTKIIILPPVDDTRDVEILEAKLSAFQVINFKGRALRQAQNKLMASSITKQVRALADDFYGRLLVAALPRHGGLNA